MKFFSASSREIFSISDVETEREARPITRRPCEANSSAFTNRVFLISSVKGAKVCGCSSGDGIYDVDAARTRSDFLHIFRTLDDKRKKECSLLL